jgi:hypothetical protein
LGPWTTTDRPSPLPPAAQGCPPWCLLGLSSPCQLLEPWRPSRHPIKPWCLSCPRPLHPPLSCSRPGRCPAPLWAPLSEGVRARCCVVLFCFVWCGVVWCGAAVLCCVVLCCVVLCCVVPCCMVLRCVVLCYVVWTCAEFQVDTACLSHSGPLLCEPSFAQYPPSCTPLTLARSHGRSDTLSLLCTLPIYCSPLTPPPLCAVSGMGLREMGTPRLSFDGTEPTEDERMLDAAAAGQTRRRRAVGTRALLSGGGTGGGVGGSATPSSRVAVSGERT